MINLKNNSNDKSTQDSKSLKNKKLRSFSFPNLEKVRSLLYSKAGIATVFTLIGFTIATLVIGMYLKNSTGKENAKYHPDKVFESDFTFNHDPFFFSSSDIFDEMRKVQQRMNRAFESHRRYMDQTFLDTGRLSMPKLKPSNKKTLAAEKRRWSKVTAKQDDISYIYELSFAGFDKDNISISIKNNILTLSARQKEKSKSKQHQLYSDANFYYSFAVPKHKGKPDIVRKNNKIIVTLSKEK